MNISRREDAIFLHPFFAFSQNDDEDVARVMSRSPFHRLRNTRTHVFPRLVCVGAEHDSRRDEI